MNDIDLYGPTYGLKYQQTDPNQTKLAVATVGLILCLLRYDSCMFEL